MCGFDADTGQCAPRTPDDCARTAQCFDLGYCDLSPERTCIVGDCSKSRACAVSGRCKNEGGICVVETAADCQKSEGCKLDGKCSAVSEASGLVCVKP